MAENGKIYITISDNRSGGGSSSGQGGTDGGNTPANGGTDVGTGTGTSGASGQENSGTKGISITTQVTTQMANFAVQQASQAVMYSLSNIGNFTGDYEKQRDVNTGMKLASLASSVGMAFVMGGPIVGAVSAGLAIAGTAISVAYENRTLAIQNEQQNNKIEKLRQLSGLDELTNGGRI